MGLHADRVDHRVRPAACGELADRVADVLAVLAQVQHRHAVRRGEVEPFRYEVDADHPARADPGGVVRERRGRAQPLRLGEHDVVEVDLLVAGSFTLVETRGQQQVVDELLDREGVRDRSAVRVSLGLGNRREHVHRLVAAVRDLAGHGPRRRWSRDAEGRWSTPGVPEPQVDLPW